MPGVFRSSINLLRWRGAVPNALNAGRVDVFLGTAALADVHGPLARDATVAKEASSQSIWTQITGAGVNVVAAHRTNLDVLSVQGLPLELPQGGRLQVDVVHNFDKGETDVSYWRGKPVSNLVTASGLIPTYTPAIVTGTVTASSFLDAMNDAERLALEALTEQPQPGGRWARILFRRLAVSTIVDVPALLSAAEKLKPAMIEAGVWTVGTAPGRIRAWFTPPANVPEP